MKTVLLWLSKFSIRLLMWMTSSIEVYLEIFIYLVANKYEGKFENIPIILLSAIPERIKIFVYI